MADRILTCADLIRAQYGVNVYIRESDAALTADVSDAVLIPQNAGRIALVVINYSANQLVIRPMLAATLTRGIKIPPNGGMLTMSWRDDMELPAFEWHAISDIAGSAVYYQELLIIGRALSASP